MLLEIRDRPMDTAGAPSARLGPIATALWWTSAVGALHFVLFAIAATSRLGLPCDHCAPGRLVSDADVLYYFRETSGFSPHDSLVDYPPLSRFVLLAPRLFAERADTYVWLFMLGMFLVDLVTVFAVALYLAKTGVASTVRRGLAWYTAYAAALSPLILTRFDLVPAVLAFAAACAWVSNRRAPAATGAALGAAIKLFPVCVAAVGFVDELRRRTKPRWRGTVVFWLSGAILAVASWTVGGPSFLGAYSHRHLQLESAFSGVLMLGGKIFGLPVAAQISHGAVDVEMRGSGLLTRLTVPLQLALLALTLRVYYKASAPDFLRAVTAATIALILPAKVLSPQYLIWLAPFVAVLEGSIGWRARWLFLGCCLVTTVIFPFRYDDLVRMQMPAIVLLNLRNVGLVALCYLLLRDAPDALHAGAAQIPMARLTGARWAPAAKSN